MVFNLNAKLAALSPYPVESYIEWNERTTLITIVPSIILILAMLVFLIATLILVRNWKSSG